MRIRSDRLWSILKEENIIPNTSIIKRPYVDNSTIIQYQGRFYKVPNDIGEWDMSEFNCPEVFPVERVIIDYVENIDTTDRRILIRKKTSDKNSPVRVYDPNRITNPRLLDKNINKDK